MKLWGNSGILLDTQKETTEIIKVWKCATITVREQQPGGSGA